MVPLLSSLLLLLAIYWGMRQIEPSATLRDYVGSVAQYVLLCGIFIGIAYALRAYVRGYFGFLAFGATHPWLVVLVVLLLAIMGIVNNRNRQP